MVCLQIFLTVRVDLDVLLPETRFEPCNKYNNLCFTDCTSWLVPSSPHHLVINAGFEGSDIDDLKIPF